MSKTVGKTADRPDGGTREDSILGFPFTIRRRKGMRRLQLRLGLNNEILVSAPWHCPREEILRFVKKQRKWVEARMAEAPEPRSLGEWLGDHPYLSASGECFVVRIEKTKGRRTAYGFESVGPAESGVVLRVPFDAPDEENALLDLVRLFARDALHCRVAEHAKRLGLRFGKLTVRDQAGRWGSCSSAGNLSLNWRLVLLSPALQDAVLLHELAHLREPNHSPRFWALLDSYDPQRGEHERALKKRAAEIMRVGRASGPRSPASL